MTESVINIPVLEIHGYITKYRREKYGIQKTHTSDARCITSMMDAVPAAEEYLIRPVEHLH